MSLQTVDCACIMAKENLSRFVIDTTKLVDESDDRRCTVYAMCQSSHTWYQSVCWVWRHHLSVSSCTGGQLSPPSHWLCLLQSPLDYSQTPSKPASETCTAGCLSVDTLLATFCFLATCRNVYKIDRLRWSRLPQVPPNFVVELESDNEKSNFPRKYKNGRFVHAQ